MKLAQSKFDLIKHRAEIECLTTADSKEKIVALEAEVQALKATTMPNSSGRTDGRRPIAAWKKKKPKAGESNTKTMNGKRYHWCPNHQM
jgi:hypothetical protein